MTGSGSEGALTICLVTNDNDTASSVKASCPPPNVVHLFSREGLVNEQHTISDHGMRIVESAATSDAVLIDWSFEQSPAINTLCFQIRKQVVAPVLMVSRDGPETLTACLAAGADDAINLPVYLPYVQAKVLSYRRLVRAARDAQRGSGPSLAEELAKPDLVFGALRLSPQTHRFYIDGEEVELTPREFRLLEYLISRPDTLCSRSEILDAVWAINFDTGTNMVDVYMHYVRRKLEARGLKDMIETVRGLGYRLVLPESHKDSA
ncbi:MAG TPA: response regulator transcription factor [Rhodothermales bacterium]|nr:response regulator transcription factor [Rhodothermales bacterium]